MLAGYKVGESIFQMTKIIGAINTQPPPDQVSAAPGSQSQSQPANERRGDRESSRTGEFNFD